MTVLKTILKAIESAFKTILYINTSIISFSLSHPEAIQQMQMQARFTDVYQKPV